MVRNHERHSLIHAVPPTRTPIAVVTPFLDKRHGTERRVAECVSRLSDEYEFHVYSTRVEDVDLRRVIWHRIPKLPGPHLVGYLWWFAANHLWRWRDRHFRGLKPSLVYSPGINCLDADVISVHVVFARFRERMQSELRLRQNPFRVWPQILHRRMYYALIHWLEGRVYRRPDLPLAAVSRKIAADLQRYYGRIDGISVIYNGLDFERFSPERRASLRDAARRALALSEQDFAILLIGNDWKNKGLPCLLEAMAQTRDPRVRAVVGGGDNPAIFAGLIARLGLEKRVQFCPPRADVEFFYAAADAYAGPSLEDAFAQPPAEAMACGLPVITSRNNGGAEMITSGQDGFVLDDPADSLALSQLIRPLVDDPALRRRVGQAAAQTARAYTWEKNARQMRELFERARRQRGGKS